MDPVPPSSPVSATHAPASYVPAAGRYDELVDVDGSIRPHWESMLRTWATLGAEEILRRQMVAERLLVAEGAGHVFHDDRQAGVPWGLDPVPYVIDSKQWRSIERGLGQRARVLDAVLSDLYGPRRLLVDNVIPTAAVMGSRAYQLAAVGVGVRGPRLMLYAADVVRDSSGQWLVLRDHTDAPTGCGYALMNRTVLSRLYPEPFRHLGVSALSGWFSDLRSALSAVAPENVVGPRAILLGPDLQRPGFVEASYLAAHLGYHLASSGDLITRGGRVWLRTLGGLEQIDVVFRRLVDTGSDPLELGPAGTGGVTGLLQAVREGHVGVANSLGSGVADRLWLQPFLADAARHLLGETLELASIDTWWCGDSDRLAAVRADPEAFVFHDTDPVAPAPSAFGDRLSEPEMNDWLDRMTAAPHRYVVQPKIEFASTPVAIDGELRNGTASIRVQTVRIGDEVVVLPGGHGRHVAPGQLVINSPDASGKDVWVLTDPTSQRIATSSSAVARRARLPQIDLRDSLPTRSAEALFWLGRNAERAEAATRTTRLVIARAGSDPALIESAWLGNAIAAMRAVSGGSPSDDETSLSTSRTQLLAAEVGAALDNRSGAVANSLGHLAANAGGVREFLSTATWRVLNELDSERSILSATTDTSDPFLVTECLDRIMVDLAALAGLVMESMVRGPGWRFLDLGRRLERAVLLLGIVEAALSRQPDDDVAQPVYDLVLGASESLVAYRRRYRSDVRLAAIEDLLVHDDTNPRSLVFQLDRINEHLAALPWNPDASKHRRFLEAAARGRIGEGPDSLAKLVLDVRGPLLELIRELMLAWFTHPARRGLGGFG
ncbi:MAG TPA: circularly permuted type 2 ATP-grasp protein [Ilumatobacteraceae bacterium]|nr:circularly permuted type 2 ATP-grasp protein [Ilumatobacteraceae bacterium]